MKHPDVVRWEYIQQVLEQFDHNVSVTASNLGMHRRTLQRMIVRHSPKKQEVTR